MKTDALACKSECFGIASFFFLYQTFLEYWGSLGQKYILQTQTANTAICYCKSKLFWSVIFFNIWQRGKISYRLLAKCGHLFICIPVKLTLSNKNVMGWFY